MKALQHLRLGQSNHSRSDERHIFGMLNNDEPIRQRAFWTQSCAVQERLDMLSEARWKALYQARFACRLKLSAKEIQRLAGPMRAS